MQPIIKKKYKEAQFKLKNYSPQEKRITWLQIYLSCNINNFYSYHTLAEPPLQLEPVRKRISTEDVRGGCLSSQLVTEELHPRLVVPKEVLRNNMPW